MREAVRELQSGMSRQLGTEPAADVQQALTSLHEYLDRRYAKRIHGINQVHLQLWALGAALAAECWSKGYAMGSRRKAPEEGRVRIDLSVAELLQLGSLANVGFRHMMPSRGIIDTRGFTGDDDAREASRSISRIEASIPKQYRPDLLLQADHRENLIDAWWRPIRRSAA